ncbi:unnamed protein product [Arctogadus glacialis]
METRTAGSRPTSGRGYPYWEPADQSAGVTHTGSPPTSGRGYPYWEPADQWAGSPILGARGLPTLGAGGEEEGAQSPPLCGLRVNELSEDKAGARSSAEGGGPRPRGRRGYQPPCNNRKCPSPSIYSRCQHGAGMDTGVDTGMNTGVETGMDTGVDTGVETGMDTGVETGMDTGVETDWYGHWCGDWYGHWYGHWCGDWYGHWYGHWCGDWAEWCILWPALHMSFDSIQPRQVHSLWISER